MVSSYLSSFFSDDSLLVFSNVVSGFSELSILVGGNVRRHAK